jgi:geranylgeranyl diphosphate synthase type I
MENASSAREILERYRPLVHAEIARSLSQQEEIPIYEMMRHHLGFVTGPEEATIPRGGKQVRAALCMLACEAVGGETTAAAPAAAALELLHSFTLLHDDVADRDEVRRGRPTVWHKWGVGQAITAGDALFALANLTLARLEGAGVAAAAMCAIARELNQAALVVCEGQHLDISYEGRSDVRLEDYLDMIGRKTAALFAHASAIGTRIGAASSEQTEALRSFGRHLGLAFQVRDDVLGVWGEPSELGKPVGSDLRRGKRSLPIIHALQAAGAAGEKHLSARLGEGIATHEEASAIATRMEELGSRDFCEHRAQELLDSALSDLGRAQVRAGPAHDLRSLANHVIARTD